MKKIGYVLVLTISLIACKKDELSIPAKPPVENPPSNENPSGENPSTDNPSNPVLTIRLRTEMKIGAITYDSIPASLALLSWDSLGQQATSYHSLAAGTNELVLPAGKQKFQFRVSKWGSIDELTLLGKDIVEDSVYRLGATKQAKKLKTEYGYILINNKYEAESKTDYVYLSDGNLDKIVFNRKKQDGTPYIAMLSRFEYDGARVKKISRFDESNNLIGFTSFAYNAGGSVTAMSDKTNGEETIAAVEYNFSTRQEIIIRYTYPARTYTMGYYMQFANGNLLEGNGITSHHTSEMAKYQYDLNVNPYIHMNWPDLFLSHSSKNNVIAQQQTFSNGFPVAVPSGYNYTYDGEGYPKELVRTFKSGRTGEYLYTTKTVFVY